MDRVYQILINETAGFDLAAFNLDNPPVRIFGRYLVMVDRPWRHCSAELLADVDLLDYCPAWDDNKKPDNRDEWHKALADLVGQGDPGFPLNRLIERDPCCPRWHDDRPASDDPASPIKWGPMVEAAAYQGDYEGEDDPIGQAREDANGSRLV